MKALVVGASGLIGSELIRHRPADVTVRVTRRKGQKAVNDVETVVWDAAKRDNVNNPVSGIDCVIYLAQSSEFRSFPEGVEDVLQVNLLAPISLAAAAVESGVRRFLYVSTGSVYEGTGQRIRENSALCAPSSTSLYSASKLAAEHLLTTYHNSIDISIARPFFVYGPGQRDGFLFPSLFERVVRKRSILLDGMNGLIFNPLYVGDAGRILWSMALASPVPFLNLGGPEVVSLRQVGGLIGDLVGIEPRFENTGQPEKRFVASTERMEQAFGQARTSVVEGLRMMAEA